MNEWELTTVEEVDIVRDAHEQCIQNGTLVFGVAVADVAARAAQKKLVEWLDKHQKGYSQRPYCKDTDLAIAEVDWQALRAAAEEVSE